MQYTTQYNIIFLQSKWPLSFILRHIRSVTRCSVSSPTWRQSRGRRQRANPRCCLLVHYQASRAHVSYIHFNLLLKCLQYTMTTWLLYQAPFEDPRSNTDSLLDLITCLILRSISSIVGSHFHDMDISQDKIWLLWVDVEVSTCFFKLFIRPEPLHAVPLRSSCELAVACRE